MSRRSIADYSDTGRRARAIVGQEDERFYEKKKGEFLSARGEMLMSVVLQGKVLAELRSRSAGFLRRIAAETDDSLYRLGTIADFWQFFRGELPRDDISPQYYLALSRAIRLIQDSWPQIDEIAEVAAETGKELIEGVHGEIVGPTTLAGRLCQRFGILEPGNAPFNGIYTDLPESLEEIREYAGQQFHEIVQPYFVEFAQRVRRSALADGKPEESAEEDTEPVAKSVLSTMLHLHLKIAGELAGKQLEEALASIYKALEGSGVKFEVKRADAYQQR